MLSLMHQPVKKYDLHSVTPLLSLLSIRLKPCVRKKCGGTRIFSDINVHKLITNSALQLHVVLCLLHNLKYIFLDSSLKPYMQQQTNLNTAMHNKKRGPTVQKTLCIIWSVQPKPAIDAYISLNYYLHQS